MSAPVIDLNADVGQQSEATGIADDLAIMHAVSSVNVACGFHGGDGETMHALCQAAVHLHKRIGAHVSCLDPEGFGQHDLNVNFSVLRDQIVQQIRALAATAQAVGGRVSYVKPHDTLYNRTTVDPGQAEAIIAAVLAADRRLVLLAPPASQLLQRATAEGLDAAAEAFADRAYRQDGTLLPLSQPGSALTAQQAFAQAEMIVFHQQVITIEDRTLAMPTRSLCIHRDTPSDAELALRLRNHLIGAGVEIRPFS
ncbi:MAG: 5-oxoprolinase subunit PxpA [Solirubrobacteraceae bacterium]